MISAAPGIVVQSPAVGQVPVYGPLGWAAGNPSGVVRLAAAVNQTGTPTPTAAVTGVGVAVPIPGTVISIATSNGLPVVFEYGALIQQTTIGDGDSLLSVYETTAAPTSTANHFERLPNSITAPMAYKSVADQFDVGVIAATRTFQLYIQTWTTTADTPAVQTLNSANTPAWLRAVAGA